MRALVFVLILANLLFFAFAQGYFGGGASPDAVRLQQQINGERLRVVSRGSPPVAEGVPPAAPEVGAQVPGAPEPVVPPATTPAPVPTVPSADAKPTEPLADKGSKAGDKSVATAAEPAAAPVPDKTPAKPAVEACALWHGLAGPEADQLAANARKAGLKVVSKAEASSWWVFIPPLADKKTAEKKAGELQRLGVSEYFIVTDGAQKLAISLGVFSREEAAAQRLEELKGQGVRSARVGVRAKEGGKMGIEVRGDAAALATLPGGQACQ